MDEIFTEFVGLRRFALTSPLPEAALVRSFHVQTTHTHTRTDTDTDTNTHGFDPAQAKTLLGLRMPSASTSRGLRLRSFFGLFAALD